MRIFENRFGGRRDLATKESLDSSESKGKMGQELKGTRGGQTHLLQNAFHDLRGFRLKEISLPKVFIPKQTEEFIRASYQNIQRRIVRVWESRSSLSKKAGFHAGIGALGVGAIALGSYMKWGLFSPSSSPSQPAHTDPFPPPPLFLSSPLPPGEKELSLIEAPIDPVIKECAPPDVFPVVFAPEMAGGLSVDSHFLSSLDLKIQGESFEGNGTFSKWKRFEKVDRPNIEVIDLHQTFLWNGIGFAVPLSACLLIGRVQQIIERRALNAYALSMLNRAVVKTGGTQGELSAFDLGAAIGRRLSITSQGGS